MQSLSPPLQSPGSELLLALRYWRQYVPGRPEIDQAGPEQEVFSRPALADQNSSGIPLSMPTQLPFSSGGSKAQQGLQSEG